MPEALPPPQPTYTLRGHTSPIHTLLFYRNNLRLLSGDADGWIVIWDLPTKRPVAVWKGHESSVLGAAIWAGEREGRERVISQGRDSRIHVWQIRPQDESSLSTQLPVEDDTTPRTQPWLLHSLDVPSLNFCSFATCPGRPTGSTRKPRRGSLRGSRPEQVEKAADVTKKHTAAGREGEAHESIDETQLTTSVDDLSLESSSENELSPLLLAVAGAEQGSINIHSLPSECQVALIPAPEPAAGTTGMVMALRIFWRSRSAGTDPEIDDEDAPSLMLTVVAGYESGRVFVFERVARPDATRPARGSAETSQELNGQETGTWQIIYTARPHEQPILSLDISPSLDIFYTSGADAIIARHTLPISTSTPPSVPSSTHDEPKPPQSTANTPKSIQTGHSGQQSLIMRSDGRIFATAGWDGKARVYSSKTTKELAVLKWHKQGCYVVAFADIARSGAEGQGSATDGAGVREVVHGDGSHEDGVVARRSAGILTVREERIERAKVMHWIAVGSKDAKITLWDVY